MNVCCGVFASEFVRCEKVGAPCWTGEADANLRPWSVDRANVAGYSFVAADKENTDVH